MHQRGIALISAALILLASPLLAQNSMQMKIVFVKGDTLLANKGQDHGIRDDGLYSILRHGDNRIISLGKAQVTASSRYFSQLKIVERLSDSVSASDLLIEIHKGSLTVPDTLTRSWQEIIAINHLKTDTLGQNLQSNDPNNNPEVIVPILNPPVSIIWRAFDIGGGVGTNSDEENQKKGTSIHFQLDVLNFEVRFNRLTGLAVQTKLWEGTTAVTSLVPLYIKIPVGLRRARIENYGSKYIMHAYQYFFIGGNGWKNKYHYLHFGFSWNKFISKSRIKRGPGPYDKLAEAITQGYPFWDYAIKCGAIYSGGHTIESSQGISDMYEADYGVPYDVKPYWGGYLTITFGRSTGY